VDEAELVEAMVQAVLDAPDDKREEYARKAGEALADPEAMKAIAAECCGEDDEGDEEWEGAEEEKE